MRRTIPVIAVVLLAARFSTAQGVPNPGGGLDLQLRISRTNVYEESRKVELEADLHVQFGEDKFALKGKARMERECLVDLQQINEIPRPEVWKARRLVKKDSATWTLEGRPELKDESPLTGRAFAIEKTGEGVFNRKGEGCELDPKSLSDESIPFLLESALAPDKNVGLNQPWMPPGLAFTQWLKELGVLPLTLSGGCSAVSERPAKGTPTGKDTVINVNLQAKGKQFTRNLVRGPMDASIKISGSVVRSGTDGCFSEVSLRIESTVEGKGELPDGTPYVFKGTVVQTVTGGVKKSAQKFVVPAKDTKILIVPRVVPGLKEVRTRAMTIKGKEVKEGGDPAGQDFEILDTGSFTQETLEADFGVATKARRSWAARDFSFVSAASKTNEHHPHALAGKVVDLKSSFGIAFPSCADPKVAPQDLAGESFWDESLFLVLRRRPVAVGESWKPDAVDAKSWIASVTQAPADSTDLKCTLKEIVALPGEKAARVEVTGTYTIAEDREGGVKVKGTGKVKATIDVGLTTGAILAETVEADLAATSTAPAGKKEMTWKCVLSSVSKPEASPKK